MAAPTIFASVVTNPGGTGSTIIPALSTHAAGDVIEIFIGKTGNVAWSPPAGWSTKQQLITSGSAAASTVGTLIFRRVLPGDSLPLASPVCNLGATVTRGAICQTRRGTDVEGVHVLSEWQAFGTGTGTSNPIRPSSITTPAPEMEVTHYYCQRAATNAPEPTDYTQTQQIVISGTLVINVATRTVNDQQTTLSNQDASPTSGARWVAMISAAPSPDYSYYRSGSQAFNANGTDVTPALPAGTTASDNRGNKDLIVLTAQCAGADPTVNTPGHWTLIDEWSNTTSGGNTTVRKWITLYTGTLDRQVNRTPSGEIFAYLSVYHNAHQSIPIGTSAVQQNASSTTSTFPALPRTGTHATVQATCVADGTPTFTAPSGWTERNDSQGVTCADQSFNPTGTTASASFTLNSASPTLAGLMEVFSVVSVINLILTPATASLTLTGFAPTVSITDHITVTPDTASLTLTTFAPNVIIPTDFPFTNALDDFNRANENPIANGTWGGQIFAGDANIELVSNQARGVGSSTGSNHGWLTQYGPDCEVYIEIVTLNGDDSVQVFARLSEIGGSFDGYSVRARGGAINNLIVLRWDNGAIGAGLVTLPQIVSAGDWFGMRLVGDLIEVYYKDVSESSEWFLLGDVTDATYADAGYLALYTFNNVNVIDNFSGGTIGVVIVTPANASLTLSTFTPKLVLAVTVPAVSLTLTTFAPVVSISVLVTPASALLSLAAFAPSLQLSITPPVIALTATTFAPQLQESLTPASTALTLTTFAPSVTVAVTVIPTTALLSLTTFAPSVDVSADVIVTPAAAALTLTSFTAQLREVVTPASQSLVLTTFAPKLAQVVTPANATLALTSFAPAVSTNTIVTPASTALTLTTTTPQLRETVTVGAASLSLTTFSPTIATDVTVIPATASLTLTQFAPVLHERLTPAVSTLTLTTFAPEITISADITVTPTTASLVLTTFAPDVVAGGDVTLTPATVILTLSTFAPTLSEAFTPANSTLTLTTFTPALTESITLASASLIISTFAVSLRETTTVGAASLTLTTFAPTITTGAAGETVVIPAPATLTLTSYAPFIIAAGPTPPSRTFVVSSARRTFTVRRPNRTYLVPAPDREEMLV